MQIKLIGGTVYAPERLDKKCILIDNGSIVSVSNHIDLNCTTINAEGCYIVPGFIDLHVHGGGGFCCMDGRPESVIAMANAHAMHGTTTILPTTWTEPMHKITGAIDAIRQASVMPCKATIAGAHVEGPCLSPEQSGAQNLDDLRIPAKMNFDEILSCWDGIKIVGIAPELPGANELGDMLMSRNIVASIAHSNAFEPDIKAAVAHGFTDVTHLYSCCSTFVRRGGFRIPGVVECALAYDALTVQVIADGRHLPDTMIKLIWNAKGTDAIELITDGLDYSASNLEEGSVYTQQNGQSVVYEDGVMKLMSRQAFAGSVATTDRLLRVAIGAGIPFPDALRMLTENPARKVGLSRKGKIREGYDADIVILNQNYEVVGVISKGEILRLDI